MAKESDNILYNLTNSFYDFFTTEEILKGVIEKTILGWYDSPQLAVVLGFPDLTEILVPTIAIDFNSSPASAINFMGGRRVKDYFFNLFGFAGWTGKHGDDMAQRDKLISDVDSLLDDSVVTVNDWVGNVKGSLLGYGTVLNPASIKLPQTGTSLAEKYRFLTTGIVRILEK